jgi:hypothetical protein
MGLRAVPPARLIWLSWPFSARRRGTMGLRCGAPDRARCADRGTSRPREIPIPSAPLGPGDGEWKND